MLHKTKCRKNSERETKQTQPFCLEWCVPSLLGELFLSWWPPWEQQWELHSHTLSGFDSTFIGPLKHPCKIEFQVLGILHHTGNCRGRDWGKAKQKRTETIPDVNAAGSVVKEKLLDGDWKPKESPWCEVEVSGFPSLQGCKISCPSPSTYLETQGHQLLSVFFSDFCRNTQGLTWTTNRNLEELL